MKVLDVGGNDGLRAKTEFYPHASITVIDQKTGWDVMDRGLPNGPWDVLLLNHIVEHVLHPDYLLEECYRVMNRDSILNIGTPNLTAWFNRILFILGYVPHSVELSEKYNVGKLHAWNQESLGGHRYVYTLPALAQLLHHHGFMIVRVLGEHSTYPCHSAIRFIDRVCTFLSPTLASAIRIYAKKRV